MTYKVRLWIEDGKVLCCSSVCTEQSCPRVGICEEVEIIILSDDEDDFEDVSDTLPCGCCACCGCNCNEPWEVNEE